MFRCWAANGIDLASVAEDLVVSVDGCRSEWTQRSGSKARCSQSVQRVKNMKVVQMFAMIVSTWTLFEPGVIPARISSHNAIDKAPESLSKLRRRLVAGDHTCVSACLFLELEELEKDLGQNANASELWA